MHCLKFFLNHLFAVTEAIVNAVCHRDYTSNASVQVMLFNNRLEIWNPGQLPYGLTIEMLKTEHPSRPANPLIAHPMYLYGSIEQIGTGTKMIIEKCLEQGLKEPEFKQELNFITTFWRKEKSKKNVTENTSNVPEKVGEKVTGNQQIIIENLINDPYISASNLSIIVGMSSRKIEENLSKLKAKGIIERIGPDKGGYWKVKQI